LVASPPWDAGPQADAVMAGEGSRCRGALNLSAPWASTVAAIMRVLLLLLLLRLLRWRLLRWRVVGALDMVAPWAAQTAGL